LRGQWEKSYAGSSPAFSTKIGEKMNIFKLVSIILFTITFQFSSTIEDIRTQYRNGEFDSAYSVINEYISGNDTDPLGFNLASDIALALDSLGKANEFLLKAIDLDKANEELRKKWSKLDSLRISIKEANRKLDSDLISEAIRAYEDIIDLFPKFAMSYFRLGRIYYSENNLEDAVYYFRKAVDLNPFNSTYNGYITNIAKKLAKEGNDIFRRKDYELAAEKYIQSTKIDPTYTEAYYRAGKSFYVLRDYETARSNLERAIENSSDHVQSLKLLGDLDSKEGNDENAIKWYEKAVEVNSNYHIAYYSLGKSYYKIQQNSNALFALKNAVLVDPTYAKAYELMGIIEQERGNLDSSILNYKLAVENNKKAYIANFRLASVLNEKKNYAEAKVAAKACINVKRKYAAAWYELGISEKNLGNKAAAKIAFKEASKDRKWKESAQYEIKMLSKES
jgi:tetratricopeptide (TPR) repeat protein